MNKVKPMTLSDAIDHADAQAHKHEQARKQLPNLCANEHKQLAAWLRELKGRRKLGKDEGYWQCPYCYKEVADEHAACCGEVGHIEFVLKEISND